MATQIIMDSMGDTRHEFDAADHASVAAAQARFRQLTGAGFTAAARSGGRLELLRSFDANVEETLFIPRLRGG